METKLSINDKVNILDITSIQDRYIVGENRKAIVFEYFSKFEQSFLYSIIEELNLDFQVKIKKELYLWIKEELLSSEYYDIQKLQDSLNSKYSIILESDKENEVTSSKIEEGDIINFISKEKWELYLYRHYLIINVTNDQDINKMTFDFLSKIKQKDIIIRLLKEKELTSYLFSEINFPLQKIWNSYQNKEKEDNPLQIHKILLDPSNLAFTVVKKIHSFIHTIEDSFFQWKLEWIDQNTLNVLENNTIKWNNNIQIWNNFKGGLNLKWIPKDDFNILKFLFIYLNVWDSITINLYPEQKHILEKVELKGINKYLHKDEEVEYDWNYLQLLINFNDINETLLEKRIKQFQLDIWDDFYTQRVIGTMSKYFKTFIGTWENNLNNERLYSKERLINHLIF